VAISGNMPAQLQRRRAMRWTRSAVPARESRTHQRLAQARQSTISGLENGQLAAHICGNAKGPCWNANGRSYGTRWQQITLGGGGGAWLGGRCGKDDDPAQSCRHPHRSTASDRSSNRGHASRRGAESRTMTHPGRPGDSNQLAKSIAPRCPRIPDSPAAFLDSCWA
jgi:hypothetical protein